MNREIAFRGKRKDNGEWEYGYYVYTFEIGYNSQGITDVPPRKHYIFGRSGDFCEVDPETVGQYTGLKDKNGKEIYKNHVVLITGEQELDYGLFFQWNEKAVVRWDDDECGFYLNVINKREVNLCQDGYFTVDTFPLRKWSDGEWSIEYEIIGNIHEPNLLQEETK